MFTHTSTNTKANENWRHCRQFVRGFLLVLSFINASGVITQAAGTELALVENPDQAVHQVVDIASTANRNTVSLTDEQLRNLKFFLAGGILTLLIVLICGLLRSSPTRQEVPPQVYAYQPPPQHFISSPPQIPVPVAPPPGVPSAGTALAGTAATGTATEGETHPQNAAIPPMPHGMFYPSIPLSLSMPVAWQAPAYPAPVSLQKKSEPSETTHERAETTSSTEPKADDDTLHSAVSLPIRDDNTTAPKVKSHSRAEETDAQPATEKILTQRDTAPLPDDTFELDENQSPRPTLSPILGDIISHTRYLKNLT
ncbi:MAG: hypothetical protein CMM07_13605 [Rhodopirellula sp.]|nr:hypothetical protein [Rhodopirellula sp.]